jgi:hypothetical protein
MRIEKNNIWIDDLLAALRELTAILETEAMEMF